MGIQVLYEGQPVQTLSLILLRFENTGNEPITENDYSEPIRISIAQDAQIGEVTVQETRPEGIPLRSTISNGNEIELARVLLNPGDQAVVKILALNNDGVLRIDGRIAGITQIEKVTGLQESNAAQSSSHSMEDVLVSVVLVFGIVGAILGFDRLIDSRWFNQWRKMRYGYDPAAAYYSSAQRYVLTGELSKAIHSLDRAFSWDKSYIEKSQKHSAFLGVQDYEPYQAIIDKYKLFESHMDTPTTPPSASQ